MRKRKEPPEGAKKVPGMMVWVTEDGTAYGVLGKLTPHLRGRGKSPCLSYMTDEGREKMGSSTVAHLMAVTWMPPKPTPDAQVEHLDGNPWNNAASNLAWRVPMGAEARRARYKERLIAAMTADPHDRHHGTKGGYDAGCRCQRCRNVSKLTIRRYQTEKTIKEVEDACGRTTQHRS